MQLFGTLIQSDGTLDAVNVRTRADELNGPARAGDRHPFTSIGRYRCMPNAAVHHALAFSVSLCCCETRLPPVNNVNNAFCKTRIKVGVQQAFTAGTDATLPYDGCAP